MILSGPQKGEAFCSGEHDIVLWNDNIIIPAAYFVVCSKHLVKKNAL